MTGWRDELLAVVSPFGAEPAFLVERAAYPLLGCKGYGVHVNGYVQLPPDAARDDSFPRLPCESSSPCVLPRCGRCARRAYSSEHVKAHNGTA